MNFLFYTTAMFIFILAISFKPLVIPGLHSLISSPADLTIGVLSTHAGAEELREHYRGKNAILIGGTRGVGYGTALAMVTAGAHVTVVGRSEESGNLAIEGLRAAVSEADAQERRVRFIQGDLGTVNSSMKLVRTLASQDEKFDYLVVSAATFPNWDAPLLNEDGIDKSYAIAVVGRFLIYRNMHRFLTYGARVLNVLASGQKNFGTLDRELAAGERISNNLFENMMTFALANELMQIGLEKNDSTVRKTTRVSTHPGILKTDLHRGQGIWFDILESVAVAIMGVTEEECGTRQAGILASNLLHGGGLSYVDQFNKGKIRSSELQLEVDTNLEWLWSQLMSLEMEGTR